MTPRAAVPGPDLSVELSLVAARLDLAPPTDIKRTGDAEPTGRPLLVAGMDEVGRGALAGPVSVGVVVVALPDAGPQPAVRDSKVLSAKRREALVPEILAWGAAAAVGHAEPGEIDRYGISAALALAGRRAWHRVAVDLGRIPDALVLDGRDNWLPRSPLQASVGLAPGPGAVHLQVKADATCATVAAASILAKVERDGLMTGLSEAFPDYGWEGNKGYGAAAHRQAIWDRGPSPYHRMSWNLGLSRGQEATPAWLQRPEQGREQRLQQGEWTA
ncbi:ribonuclease HII [Citricoccus sp.]|uniref:ribonuclease HII n=1 Tax=Citricoccus sp. TaxID=1978372 RepID=UPI0028BE335D|nr:ribonuclease HII [Citricoccus sp.]